MLKQFRTRYPHGSLISELIEIDRGQYLVRVTIQVNEVILSTGLAAAEKIETAEDKARERALFALVLDSMPQIVDTPQQVIQSPDKVDKVSDKSSNLVDLASKLEVTKDRDINPVNSSVTTKTPEVVSSHKPKLFDSPPPTSIPEIEPTRVNTSVATESVPELPELPTTTPAYQDTPATADSDQELGNNSTPEIIEFDFNEIKNKTDVEIKRLGWTKEQGRDFLLTTYGKRSRLHLTDEELMDFLHYLESQ